MISDRGFRLCNVLYVPLCKGNFLKNDKSNKTTVALALALAVTVTVAVTVALALLATSQR